jgi:hypothetical protein
MQLVRLGRLVRPSVPSAFRGSARPAWTIVTTAAGRLRTRLSAVGSRLSAVALEIVLAAERLAASYAAVSAVGKDCRPAAVLSCSDVAGVLGAQRRDGAP